MKDKCVVCASREEIIRVGRCRGCYNAYQKDLRTRRNVRILGQEIENERLKQILMLYGIDPATGKRIEASGVEH